MPDALLGRFGSVSEDSADGFRIQLLLSKACAAACSRRRRGSEIFHSGQLRANPELPLAEIVACCRERLRESVRAMAVPEGYVPVVAFRFCPPSGIFFQLGMYLLVPRACWACCAGCSSVSLHPAPHRLFPSDRGHGERHSSDLHISAPQRLVVCRIHDLLCASISAAHGRRRVAPEHAEALRSAG